MTAQSVSRCPDSPISLAKTLTVPRGRTPKEGRWDRGSDASPLTTSFTVPSPPAATMTSAPSWAASIARRVASPAAVVGRSFVWGLRRETSWMKRRALLPRADGLKMTEVTQGVSPILCGWDHEAVLR